VGRSEGLLTASRPAFRGLAAAHASRLHDMVIPPAAVVLAATLAGLAVRLAHVLPAGFPLNDGGLFYLMAEDVQRAGYVLPEYSSYNSIGIPFAYPPLAYYLAAFLADIGPWSLLDVVRFLPLAASTLTIPFFYLLSRSLLPSRTMALIAVLVFALLPRSFNWEIVGGGLTRSPGFLFAVLALHQGYSLFNRGGAWRVVSTGAFAALAVMSHPEMGWLVAFSLAIFLVAWGRSLPGLRSAFLAALVAVLMTAPWWGMVLARHGIGPLLSAAQSGRHDWYSWAGQSLLTLSFTEEPFFPLLAAVGVVGFLVCLAERRFLLPVWLVAMFIMDPRKASTHAMMPLAMLVGIAVGSLLLPFLAGISSGNGRLQKADAIRGLWPHVALVALLVYGVASAVGTASDGFSPLHALSQENRQAMQWVANNTPDEAAFLVIKGGGSPWIDDVSEWFPALARRPSLATVQGYEWLGKAEYERQQRRYHEIHLCARRTTVCLDRWAQEAGVAFSHVYLPKGGGGDCCAPLRSSLFASPWYRVIYDGPGATVFVRTSPVVEPQDGSRDGTGNV